MESTSNLSNKDILHYVKENSINKTMDVLLRTNQHLNEDSLRSSIKRIMSKHSNLMKSKSKVNGTLKVEEFEHKLFVLPVSTGVTRMPINNYPAEDNAPHSLYHLTVESYATAASKFAEEAAELRRENITLNSKTMVVKRNRHLQLKRKLNHMEAEMNLLKQHLNRIKVTNDSKCKELKLLRQKWFYIGSRVHKLGHEKRQLIKKNLEIEEQMNELRVAPGND